jgi:hypothetical protein
MVGIIFTRSTALRNAKILYHKIYFTLAVTCHIMDPFHVECVYSEGIGPCCQSQGFLPFR